MPWKKPEPIPTPFFDSVIFEISPQGACFGLWRPDADLRGDLADRKNRPTILLTAQSGAAVLAVSLTVRSAAL